MASDSLSVIPSTILVPVDFSPSSRQAVDEAVELAEKFGAKLYLLHIVPESSGLILPQGVTEQSLIDTNKRNATEQFERSLSDLKSRGLKVTTRVEVGGDVAGTILDVIEREHIDLIVISTHGLSGWYPAIFGSVTEKLLRLVPCPLLLLRTPKPKSSARVPSERLMEWWTVRA